MFVEPQSLEPSSDGYASPVTERARPDAGEQTVKWLTAAEVDSWLSVVRLITWLPWSIDQQLRRDSNLGMVEYQVLAADGRFTNAILTEKGFRALAEAAPGHVAHVRSLVIDVLSPEQLRRLGRDANRITSRIDTSEAS